MADLRWYPTGASSKLAGNRIYKVSFATSWGASGPITTELGRHGRVLYIAHNQPGTVSGVVMHSLAYWLPAASVVAREDTFGTLAATLRARAVDVVTRAVAPNTTVTAVSAQVTEGARESLWDQAGDRPYGQLNIAEFTRLAGPTVTETVTRSAAGTAARVQTTASAAFETIGDAADGLTDGVSNTFLYTKIALGLIGAGLAIFIATGGEPARLFKGA